MAFPVIGSISEVLEELNVATHNFVMPAGVVVGDLLLGLFALDGVPTISGMQAGWTQLFEIQAVAGGTGHVWYRIADGTEADGTYTSSANEVSVNRIYRFTAVSWHGVTPPEAAAIDHGATANPDPPNLAPSWGAEDNLFLAFLAHDGAVTVSAFPANYADNQYEVVSLNVAWAIATRELNAGSDDPGTFTVSASDNGVVATLAVRPAAAAVAGGGGGGVALIFT